MNGHTNARLKLAAALSLVVALCAAWAAARTNVFAQEGGMVQANRQPAQAAPQGQPGQQQENPVIAELRKSIAGKEDKPAGEVFKNIQVLKTVPAGHLLGAMGSFTRALGVRCDFCHVFGEWEKDDKDMKRAARDMIHMTQDINSDLKKMQTIAADNPSVGCSTCHRGQPKPGADRPRPQATPTPSATPLN
jgi:Photosynthetic reaction centre cytochrome C subunit